MPFLLKIPPPLFKYEKHPMNTLNLRFLYHVWPFESKERKLVTNRGKASMDGRLREKINCRFLLKIFPSPHFICIFSYLWWEAKRMENLPVHPSCVFEGTLWTAFP